MTLKTNAFLALLAASALSLPSFAQTTTDSDTETQETTTEAPKEEPRVEEAFPIASDDTETQVGQQYVQATFDDWEVRCIKAAEGSEDTCGLYQLLQDGDGNGVAEFNVVALPKGSQAVGGVTFITPLGTLLTSQATMRIDSGKARRYPFSWCERSGCVARFGLTDGEMNSLKRGNKAIITIAAVAAPNEPIELNLSLVGITAAWNSIAPK